MTFTGARGMHWYHYHLQQRSDHSKTFDLISNTESDGKDFVVGFRYHISQLGLYQQEPDEATRTKQKWKLHISEKQ